MSVSASIDLRVIQSNTGNPVAPVHALEILMDHGWSLQHDGYVYYLPLGHDDPFDCITEMMSIKSLLEILRIKEAQSELIVVSLTWKNTNIGGSLFLYDANKALHENIHTPIGFSLDKNKKKLIRNDSLEMTDVNWYLEKILPTFNGDNTFVEHFTYNEHR